MCCFQKIKTDFLEWCPFVFTLSATLSKLTRCNSVSARGWWLFSIKWVIYELASDTSLLFPNSKCYFYLAIIVVANLICKCVIIWFIQKREQVSGLLWTSPKICFQNSRSQLFSCLKKKCLLHRRLDYINKNGAAISAVSLFLQNKLGMIIFLQILNDNC